MTTRMLDGSEVIDSARDMGSGRAASMARAMSVPLLYHGMERIFAAEGEPVAACGELLNDVSSFFRLTARYGAEVSGEMLAEAGGEAGRGQNEDVEVVTGEHYGSLFEGFSVESYLGEPVRLLRERLERNGIGVDQVAGRRVLDAGCGGGRYTLAWRMIGAGEVVGVDISPVNIETARRRLAGACLDGVSFIEGNVLALPFPEADFDLVFSNGVLHHTVDWRRGIGEMLRVLRPGGLGWLYLIESPGGLFWEVIEIMRQIMAGEERGLARQVLGLMGLPANRVFYMLDHVMAPINIRLTPGEIEAALGESGATGIMRLRRGVDFDRVERLYRGERDGAVKYGIGENRYIFSKEPWPQLGGRRGEQ